MENKKIFCIFISITLLIININGYISSFLPCGLNQLNNFIYLDRLKKYISQNYSKRCSMDNGPNCFFAEIKRSEIYENDQLNDDIKNSKEIIDIKKEWMDIFIKSKETDYLNGYNDINSYINEYKNYILSKNDSKQIPPSISLHLSLTFESYDELTKNGDIYAYPSKPVKFFTENIDIEIFGRLRLHYGEELNFKNVMKYPARTFGIIESTNLIIRLGRKLFICEFFFLRIRDIKIDKIKIEGFLENTKAFSLEKEKKSLNNKKWEKIILPHQQIDRIVIPGGLDVDNFSFIIDTKKQYDISVHFHANYKQRIKELVIDDDIY